MQYASVKAVMKNHQTRIIASAIGLIQEGPASF